VSWLAISLRSLDDQSKCLRTQIGVGAACGTSPSPVHKDGPANLDLTHSNNHPIYNYPTELVMEQMNVSQIRAHPAEPDLAEVNSFDSAYEHSVNRWIAVRSMVEDEGFLELPLVRLRTVPAFVTIRLRK
jgi:hypothetical protein